MRVDTVLPPRQIKLLESSFAAVQKKGSAFAITFYETLFKDYPQVRPLFVKTDMAAQLEKLMNALSNIVENLRYPSLVTNTLKSMGIRNVSYGVLPEHYPLVGNVLLKSLKLHLGEQWTPEVEAAWTAAYTTFAYLMLEAAERSGGDSVRQTKDEIVQPNEKKKTPPVKVTPAVENERAETLKQVTDTILPIEQIIIIENSFAPIKSKFPAFAATFYELLFQENPQIKPLFAESNSLAQYEKLIDSLLSIIDNLRDSSVLINVVKKMGKTNTSYGLLPEHYPLVGKALLKSLKFYLESQWTSEVQTAWIEAYNLITSLMIQGVKQKEDKTKAQTNNVVDRYEKGKEKLQQIYGQAGDRYTKSLKDIAPDLSRYVIEFGFGDIYSRPGLDLKSRQIATIAALVVLGNAESQLMDNIHGALNAGCTQDEIVEVMIQMTLYAGFPAVLRAIEVAKVVFAERD
ncbi:MAG: globin domain-containing protein [Prochloraceae cyanobacterium]|nr:globin domain-containing protein [Prochloraceae cyanobacterium]